MKILHGFQKRKPPLGCKNASPNFLLVSFKQQKLQSLAYHKKMFLNKFSNRKEAGGGGRWSDEGQLIGAAQVQKMLKEDVSETT